MKSTGQERTFSTGAVRDAADKKPMLQLISPFALNALGEWLRFACKDRKPKPYPKRNWEKGMPFSETVGSMERHIQEFKAGSTVEDNLAAVMFGAMALLHYQHEIKAGRMNPVIDDMPKYEQHVTSQYEQIRNVISSLQEQHDPNEPTLIDPLPPCPRCKGVMIPCYHPETGPECYCETCGFTSLDDLPKYDSQGDECFPCSPNDSPDSATPRGERDFCRFCGASDPPILSEGTCSHCPSSALGNMGRECDGTLTIPPENILYKSPPSAESIEEWINSKTTPTFYVAGPMRGYDNFNFPAFDAARKRGEELGYNIISPADLDREAGIDPLKNPGSSEIAEQNIKDIIQRDITAIMSLRPERGDGITVLPGWANSTGARAEVALALWLDLRIVDSVDFLDVLDSEIE